MRVGTCVLREPPALFVIAFLRGKDLRVRGTIARLHIVVAGSLNVACFSVLTAFAQLATTTSRVAVLTMPIWAALFARLVLGERLDVMRGISLVLCVSGLAVLVYPLLGSSDLIGLALALGTAVCWAAGTVYLKWAQIDVDPLVLSAWQVMVALAATVAGLLLTEGSLHLWPADPRSLMAWFLPGWSAGCGLSFVVRYRATIAGHHSVARRLERPGHRRRRIRARAG